MNKAIYDPKQDPRFQHPVIDQDEWRERFLPGGEIIPYRYMHGYFDGTSVKFAFCFPPAERYENRFQQYLSPFPGPDEEVASIGHTGTEDRIGFALKCGAYYVETNMDYQDPEAGLNIHLEQGYRHLDGAKSLEYLRYRGEELGDVGRVQRQQKFVKAVYSKILQFETLPKLPAIADIFKNEVETSAEVFDSAHLANVLRGISSEQPISVMLPGSTAENDYTIWIPDGAGIQNRMQELFRPSDIEQSESTDKEEKND